MDTWMFAVAAGVAQHFKKFKQKNEQITSESSSFNTSFNNNKPNFPRQPPNKKCPFRRSTKRNNLKQDDSEGTNVTSTSEFDSVISGSCEGSSVFFPMFPGVVGSDNRESEGMGTPPRSRMQLRNRRAIKPLTSLECCLMASEHVEMKGSPFPSPSSSRTIRPFLVTDGRKVINRSSGVTFTETMGNDAMLHICVGMSFGILYSFMANRREVEKLNRLLKHTESLVQDLEEELEMKDLVTMQEVTVNDHKSQRTDDGSPHNSEQINVSKNEECVVQKSKDESFSKIEKELEAELEMLELNMTSSNLERRISDLFEVDPDFEAGVGQGELRAHMVLDNRNHHESGSRSTTATPSANYAVSPTELSLRLHELLQSQLEQRIKELEAEIESKKTTQNHNNNKSWKDDLSSSHDENPNPVDDEPVVLNLSDEALDAYNEACNEFAKFDDDDSDDNDDENGTPVDGREDDKDFDEDEMEKMLIKHIVEKARQGSPMVLNAQRVLFSESNL